MRDEAVRKTIDGNEAAADVAYRLNEIACIYPITPSSSMGELADVWAARGRTNIWGDVVSITEMQSEGGAAGAVHGALQGGALATTFTASQGLLLMIPNMYKIAGELTPFCMHVAARTVATHALSIFGDHSDVMACRQTGFALLSSASVQEAHDFACIAQAATFESRVPFLHFFDGFRTSHEIAKIDILSDDVLRRMMDEQSIAAHRARGLSPDHPVLRGSAQNPDTFFQAREACNRFYDACPGIVEDVMTRFSALTGRGYRLFDYYGAPNAEQVVIVMGSASATVRAAVNQLNADGRKTGVVTVHLYRPFSTSHLLQALPPSARRIAVLDRTKEPGAPGEPLYLDVCAALRDSEVHGGAHTEVIAGRYGLSSKEFTPAMARAVFEQLFAERPRSPFTVGIVDDVTHLSLDVDTAFDREPAGSHCALFYGLGSDGTVGANKNTIKIMGEADDRFVQAYFVYDSKKSGAMTISHLRFSAAPIDAPYLITRAGFVACHQFNFLGKVDVLAAAEPGATFLVNAPYSPRDIWAHLPQSVQGQIIEKKLRLFCIDANTVAREFGLQGRINTIMQACFFKISNVLDVDVALAKIEESIRQTYGKKGDEVVSRNCGAARAALEHLHEVAIPAVVSSDSADDSSLLPEDAPDFVRAVTSVILAGKGDLLPVSAFPVDGTWPTGTTRYEKRNIADEIPAWDPGVCIQCNKCAMVCPHAAIRASVYKPEDLSGAPETFQSTEFRSRELPGLRYTIQVAPEDCTGCSLCVHVCPAKDKANPQHKAINMAPHGTLVTTERVNYDFFLGLPPIDRTAFERFDVKTSQFLEPLFEYSGACAGCGETPYIKLLTQLYGDRAVIANATGCSSIYGGNLPTTPYTTNRDGRGPAWANSLFEDNAEFGLGIRLSIDAQTEQARRLLAALAPTVGEALAEEILHAPQHGEANVARQRDRVAVLRKKLAEAGTSQSQTLSLLSDYLVRKSLWIVGGDGWAFDIGYGGLDHVLSRHHDVNVLVLDTEVYSNTGGQASKATPIGAAAKFASLGKSVDKKDLGLMAMNYGHVYVASVAFGAKDTQTVKAFLEADTYDGPSLIIAYSHCIAHGYNMAFGADQQARAVQSGVWPLYRYDPRAELLGESPLTIDAHPGKCSVAEYMNNEARFRMVERMNPERFRLFQRQATASAQRRVALYEHMANLRFPGHEAKVEPGVSVEPK